MYFHLLEIEVQNLFTRLTDIFPFSNMVSRTWVLNAVFAQNKSKMPQKPRNLIFYRVRANPMRKICRKQIILNPKVLKMVQWSRFLGLETKNKIDLERFLKGVFSRHFNSYDPFSRHHISRTVGDL